MWCGPKDLEQGEAGGQVDEAIQGGGDDLEDEASAGFQMLGGEVLSSGRWRPGRCSDSGAAGLLVCAGGCGRALYAS